MRALLAAVVAAAACHVPDATAPRVTYIGMASVDVGFVAALPPLLYCAFPSHRLPTSSRCGAVVAGISLAAAAATAIALANHDSDREPDLAEWLVVGTPPVLLTVVLVRELVGKLTD